MRILTRSDLQLCLSMAETIEAMAGAFAQLSSGAATVPQRIGLAAGDGVSLFMPAHLSPQPPRLQTGTLGLKAVSVHGGNAARGLPAILAAVLLVDEQTGEPLALMDGAVLTALRTAAGSGLATRYLARADAKVAAIIGAGPQGRAHALAMCAVRGIEEIRIVSRHQASSQSLADDLRGALPAVPRIRAVADASAAVRGADIICCCTNSPTPVFDGHDLQAGAHVNAIGAYTPATRETDDETIRRASRIVVDSRATVAHEAGDLVIPIKAGLMGEEAIYAELGEIVLGRKAGRQSEGEITLFKSVGNAAQDMAAARAALSRAEQLNVGLEIELRG
ncbi:MAG: ornithine cyclodeaminase family protein [Chloroflexi bacterium]|nr:ornithine cyclodeaminase family protein [Chloroflexota bacterium]